jgi:hypothetical protein
MQTFTPDENVLRYLEEYPSPADLVAFPVIQSTVGGTTRAKRRAWTFSTLRTLRTRFRSYPTELAEGRRAQTTGSPPG